MALVLIAPDLVVNRDSVLYVLLNKDGRVKVALQTGSANGPETFLLPMGSTIADVLATLNAPIPKRKLEK